MDELERLLGPKARLVAVGHVSNSLGTINPVRRIAEMARAAGAITVVDGAQAMAHVPVDVQELGCDFYAFSAHKMFGPTGVGALWGRRELLEEMPPWMGGGDMIRSVSFSGSTWAPLPSKFEAGTPDIAGVIGLGAAIDWLDGLDFAALQRAEHDLLEYGTTRLRELKGLRILGTAPEKTSVLSFVMEGVHPHDIGTILDHEGVAVRTGHHCAQPVMDRFGVPATARASLSVYNDREDIDRLVEGLAKIQAMFA
jgi:cysteine desulfurase/selenocysteine lyase